MQLIFEWNSQSYYAPIQDALVWMTLSDSDSQAVGHLSLMSTETNIKNIIHNISFIKIVVKHTLMEDKSSLSNFLHSVVRYLRWSGVMPFHPLKFNPRRLMQCSQRASRNAWMSRIFHSPKTFHVSILHVNREEILLINKNAIHLIILLLLLLLSYYCWLLLGKFIITHMLFCIINFIFELNTVRIVSINVKK